MVERFEDLVAWQEARELVRAVYLITSAPGFSNDFALRDQIRRAAISIPSNIADISDETRTAKLEQAEQLARRIGKLRASLT